MEFHEYANIFPMMDAAGLEWLRADIEKNGLTDPITTLGGKILDGRNRWVVCGMLGITPETVEYTGTDPLAFVVSKNLKRRHLCESQRAMVGGRIANMPLGGAIYRSVNLPTDTTPQISQEKAAEMVNVSERSIRNAKKVLDKGTPELVTAVDSGKIAVSAAAGIVKKEPEYQRGVVAKIVNGEAKSFRDAKRLVVRERLMDSPELNASGKFRVIYADPPWQYDSVLPGHHGSAEDHYPTMSIAELCALPVKDLAQDDAVLFLWVTAPFALECAAIIESWGFKYKAQFVWDRARHNMGAYNSVRHELLYICTRGKCTPDVVKLLDSVQVIKRSNVHSEKPEEFREIIDTLYPYGSRIELFARKPAEGWVVWGNQVNIAFQPPQSKPIALNAELVPSKSTEIWLGAG